MPCFLHLMNLVELLTDIDLKIQNILLLERLVLHRSNDLQKSSEKLKSNKKVYQNGIDMAFYYGMFSFFFTFVMFGTLDLLVWFAAYLNDTDGLTVGDFASFQFYMFSFLMNFGTVGNVFGEVMGSWNMLGYR